METCDIDIFAEAFFRTCFSGNDIFKVIKCLQCFDNVDLSSVIFTHILRSSITTIGWTITSIN